MRFTVNFISALAILISTFTGSIATGAANPEVEHSNYGLDLLHDGVTVSINGFISAGVSISDADRSVTNTSRFLNMLDPINFPLEKEMPTYRGIGDNPNFSPYTKVGIQFEAELTDKFSIVTQIVARGVEGYDVVANWAYMRYEPSPEFIFQVGRVRIPTFIFSNYIDVGYAYPWIHPPGEVYDLIPIPNIDGVLLLASKSIGEIDFGFQPFIGSADSDLSNFLDHDLELKADNIIGAQFSVSHEFVTARMSLLRTDVSLKFPPLPGFPPGFFAPVKNKDVILRSMGIEIDWGRLLVLAEYSERFMKGTMPDTHSWYTLIGLQLGKFTPYFTYADLSTVDKKKRASIPLLGLLYDRDQRSYELGLRYDVIDSVTLKASVQHLDARKGTSGLFTHIPNDDVNIFNLAIQAVF